MKCLLASVKSNSTNCEIPSINPLQRACSGFLIAPVPLKVVPNSPVILKLIVPEAGYECTDRLDLVPKSCS